MKDALPQLRTRTEFSYRNVYGRCEEVAARLQALKTPFAAIVDTHGTWGHVRFEKALKGTDVSAGFGAEFVIPTEDGRKPRCWALAENLAEFYKLSSSAPETPQAMAEAKGVIRFAGAALDDPECFDYIDVNPVSVSRSMEALELARRTGKPLVVTGMNDYPAPEHRHNFLAWADNARMTPQHILGEEELRQALWFMTDEQFRQGVHNAHEVAERLQGIKLREAPMIEVPHDLWRDVLQGKEYRINAGHISKWTEEYEARLKREMDMIAQKSFESYFTVVADLVKWSKQHMLIGPARGSSAGSLVCYLLAITEVDPLVHGLLFERFIDINRDDLPDIDIDFNDKKRGAAIDYLSEKYGSDNVAHIGNISTLKPRSVMAHAGKKLGISAGATFSVINVLIEYSSGDARYGKGLEDTLQNTQPGREFMTKYPEAALMGALENHASHTGVHAAGILVSNVPITEYCTVRDGVAQIDKKDSEYLNLLKIDVLGLRTLGVIEDAGVVSNEQLYGMTMDDPAVFDIFNKGKFSGLFQFEGAAQRRVSLQVPVDDFRKIDHVTALARPGPLGGGAANKYINRNLGKEPIVYRHDSMAAYLADTQGVVLYQEQVMRIVREIGNFSWEDTSVIRKAMSGRKGTEFFQRKGEQFAEGAARLGIDEQTAADIWQEICSFGAWGMNASHTCSYAFISYWCAYMKCYHPLEYAAACLRNAKDDVQVVEILRELNKEGVEYKPFDPQLSMENWAAADGKLLGGFTNLKGIGAVKAAYYVKKRANEGLTDADLKKIAKHEPKHADLYPGRTLWGHMYDNPAAYNIAGKIKLFAELEDFEEAVVICQLVRRDRRDENESVRIARRGGERKEGQTLFLDMFVVDDSVSKPVLARVKPREWFKWGIPIADKAVDGDWFLIRGKWLKQFSMISIKKIKCLTNPEVL